MKIYCAKQRTPRFDADLLSAVPQHTFNFQELADTEDAKEVYEYDSEFFEIFTIEL